MPETVSPSPYTVAVSPKLMLNRCIREPEECLKVKLKRKACIVHAVAEEPAIISLYFPEVTGYAGVVHGTRR